MPTFETHRASILEALDGTTSFPNGTALALGLSTTEPAVDASNINEPAGADGYAQQAITLGAVVPGTSSTPSTRPNTNAMLFGPASDDWGLMAWGVLYVDGVPRYYQALNDSREVNTGDTFRVAVGAFNVGQE
ncbi:MAG: hypothetical protein AAF721_00405 [Myxococcota bacterium]